MKRWLLALGVATLLVPAGSVRAQGHSAGVQVLGLPILGVYKTGAGGGFSSPGFSGPVYSSPVYSSPTFSSPVYSAPMMAPGGGCTGYSAFSSPGYGFSSPTYSAPMMAPGSGCTGFSAFSSPGYGFSSPAYSAPGYGYYSGAQAGILPGFGGGLLDAIRVFREIQSELDRMGRGGAGSSADVKALSDKLDRIEAKVNKIPDDVTNRLDKIDEQLQEVPDIKKRLDRLEKKGK